MPTKVEIVDTLEIVTQHHTRESHSKHNGIYLEVFIRRKIALFTGWYFAFAFYFLIN